MSRYGSLRFGIALVAPAASAPIADFVLASVTPALSEAEEKEITSFLEAAEQSPWFDDIPLDVARVRAASALRQASPGAAAPADATLEKLVQNGSELANAAVAEWITAFSPSPVQVYRTLAPRLGDAGPLQDPFKTAILGLATKWSSGQKADLLDAIAEEYVQGQVHDSVVRSTGLGEADADRVGDVVIRQYEAATNNDEREQVMGLWALLNPAPERVRSKLINRIYLPLLGEGKGAASIALGHFSLVRAAPSGSAQQRVKRAIRDAAEGQRDLSKRANRLLKEAGWVSKKRKWLPW